MRFLRQKRWQDVDVIHVHLFPAQLFVALCAAVLRPRARLITTEHNTFNRRRATVSGRLLDRLTLRSFEKILCISDATREALEHWQPQTRAKLVTISNGIDLTRFSAPKTPKSAGETPIIVSVGRISPQKNYETALRAIARLKNEKFEFWIAGQDELNGQMQALSRELGIADKVRFLGFQSDIAALLHRADIFLMTSSWEGFGLAVAEAMAAGLPVVVPDVPGVREVAGSAPAGEAGTGEVDAGFLIDPNSPESVAKSLAKLLQDADEREKAGAKARVRAAQFSIQRTIAAHLDLYESSGASSALSRA
jgi:glycosyltransferase involved in cell wall biosynthesis